MQTYTHKDYVSVRFWSLIHNTPADRPSRPFILGEFTAELSPPGEAASRTSVQELPDVLRNAKAHYLVHNSPQIFFILI
jgi:hypothetical protein